MLYAVIKALLSGAIVALVSETGRRSAAMGPLFASLPLVSVLGMIWLWRDTSDPVRLAAHAQATFWYVLPSLPMFLPIPSCSAGALASCMRLGRGAPSPSSCMLAWYGSLRGAG